MKKSASSRFTSRRNPPFSSGLSRREFIRLSAAASAGIAAGSLFVSCESSTNSDEPPPTARVVVVTHDQVNSGSVIDGNIVRIMINAGIIALTDAATAQEGWTTLFPNLTNSTKVGIKVNTLNPDLPSHPEVAFAIAQNIADAFPSILPLEHILIWDCEDADLAAAGYALNDGGAGVQVLGTDHPGYGYNSETIDVNGFLQRVSRCYIDLSDVLINLSVMKNHNESGVTFALKNHYGSVDTPWNLHEGECDPYIAALNSALIAQYGNRQKLCICDAIFGSYYGGASGPPNMVYQGIILSEDPVALDAIGRQILLEQGCQITEKAHYIDTASEAPYYLGVSNLDNIARIDVVNPA